jgi:hypothetical protein
MADKFFLNKKINLDKVINDVERTANAWLTGSKEANLTLYESISSFAYKIESSSFLYKFFVVYEI